MALTYGVLHFSLAAQSLRCALEDGQEIDTALVL